MNKDADLKNLKKSKIKSMFVANNRLQEILDAIKEIRQSSKNDGYENPPQCIFIAGESGSGKTWFVKFYRKQNESYDEQDNLGERTIIPVLYSELSGSKHQKSLVRQLLIDMKDPLLGEKGDVVQLTERLIKMLKECKTELIIIDEFQRTIETTNKNVIHEIAEWFKLLINKSKIPIAFFGMPWASVVFESNVQLKRRVRRRNFVLPNYTLDTFGEFQMFLQKVEEKLPVKIYEPLWSLNVAFRLFSASKGNLSELFEGVIQPACEFAIDDDREIVTRDDFERAVDEYVELDYKNPFSVTKLEDVVASQQKTSSYYDSRVKKGEERLIDPTFAKVKFSQLKLQDYLSK